MNEVVEEVTELQEQEDELIKRYRKNNTKRTRISFYKKNI